MKYTLENQETDRLKFRFFQESDMKTWLPFFKDKHIWKFLNLDESKTDEEINIFWWEKCKARYEEDRGGLMAVIDKKNNLLLGMCGLLVQDINGKKRLEVGYSFLPAARGKGYASEAAKFAKDFGFENGFDRDFGGSLVSMIHHENHSSKAVAIRNGMTLEIETVMERGHPFNIYSTSRTEWKSQRENR
ncbi:MAG: GNAT family N-acetyltransferase [Nonlabens sp.]